MPVAIAAFAQSPEANQPREVTRKAPADVGDFWIIEVPDGLTANGPEVLDLSRGSITIPQAKGISWGFGDVGCGYGLDVVLPRGMTVCFNEDHGEVEVRHKNNDDLPLARKILESAKGYRVRTNPDTGEQP